MIASSIKIVRDLIRKSLAIFIERKVGMKWTLRESSREKVNYRYLEIVRSLETHAYKYIV